MREIENERTKCVGNIYLTKKRMKNKIKSLEIL